MTTGDQTLSLPIAADHPAFAGHFPGQPVVPAVVLLDETLQALATQRALQGRWQIVSAKFHSMVLPGETVLLTHQQQSPGHFSFALHVQQRLIARGQLALQP